VCLPLFSYYLLQARQLRPRPRPPPRLPWRRQRASTTTCKLGWITCVANSPSLSCNYKGGGNAVKCTVLLFWGEQLRRGWMSCIVMQWNCFRAYGVQGNLYFLGDLVLDALFARVLSYLLHFPDSGSYPVQRGPRWTRCDTEGLAGRHCR
jgi:hypothetical protein